MDNLAGSRLSMIGAEKETINETANTSLPAVPLNSLPSINTTSGHAKSLFSVDKNT